MIRKSIMVIVAMVVMSPLVLAEDVSKFYNELNLIGSYNSNAEELKAGGSGQKPSVGFEYYNQTVNELGHDQSSDLQVRLSYNPDEDSDDSIVLEINNAYLEWSLDQRSKLIVGHFEHLLGLESTVHTYGSLMKTLAGWNVGYRHDWGIGYSSDSEDYQYKIALQTGSGMGLGMKGGSHLLTARVGSPEDADSQYGLSFAKGEIIDGREDWTFPTADYEEETSSRLCVAFDMKRAVGNYLYLGELSVGERNDKNIIGALGEIDYKVPSNDQLVLKAQLQYTNIDTPRNDGEIIDMKVVASYDLTSSCALRFGLMRELVTPTSEDKNTKAIFQLYFFGE